MSLDMALALASGTPWLGHDVPHRRRVCIVSREDAPWLTAKRLQMMGAGTPGRDDVKWGQVWVNTMDQSALLHLDNPGHLEALLKELRTENFDLVIFDVLREMHVGDENDNTLLTNTVLAATKRIQVECKCAVLVLHHRSKAQSGNVFRDTRGAGAIHGWTEWGIGISVEDESVPRKDWIRKVEFELKYACPADPVYFKISGDDSALRIELTEPPAKQEPARRAQVREIMTAGNREQRSEIRTPYREDA
jgi:RecA-family ATPase